MSKDPFNNLSALMQERLEKWRANTMTNKTTGMLRDSFKNQSPGNYVSRRRDYGDDLEEFKQREKK